MLIGKAMIVILTFGLAKKKKYEWVNMFQNQNLLEEEWNLN